MQFPHRIVMHATVIHERAKTWTLSWVPGYPGSRLVPVRNVSLVVVVPHSPTHSCSTIKTLPVVQFTNIDNVVWLIDIPMSDATELKKGGLQSSMAGGGMV